MAARGSRRMCLDAAPSTRKRRMCLPSAVMQDVWPNRPRFPGSLIPGLYKYSLWPIISHQFSQKRRLYVQSASSWGYNAARCALPRGSSAVISTPIIPLLAAKAAFFFLTLHTSTKYSSDSPTSHFSPFEDTSLLMTFDGTCEQRGGVQQATSTPGN